LKFDVFSEWLLLNEHMYYVHCRTMCANPKNNFGKKWNIWSKQMVSRYCISWCL